jgi:histidinol-phosphatase (PHP family)
MTPFTLYPPDLHVHTEYSIDATGKQLQFADTAARLKLIGVGFAEHWDFAPDDPSTGCFNYEALLVSLRALAELCEGEATIFISAEISYQSIQEDEIRSAINGKKFDYLIGSLHHSGDTALENLNDRIIDCHPDEIYIPYFEEYMGLVRSGLFNIAGHFDYPKRYIPERLGQFKYSDYAGYIDPVLSEIISSGMVLELNTGGWRIRVQEQYPSREILERYKSLGGRYVTLGSDAHNPAEVGADFDRALRMIEEIGLKPALFTAGRMHPLE